MEMTTRRISIGVLLGGCYMLFVWAAAWIGLFEWIQKEHIQHITINSLLAPFSSLAIFVFVAIYIFHKWYKSPKNALSFGKNTVIACSFCVAATLVQLPLLYFDGVDLYCIYIAEAAFLVCSFIVALLTNAFYIFLFDK
jgi:Ca2+/Na+ antiporter